MPKIPAKTLAATAVLLLASPSHAVSFPIGLEITFAAGGNPFGAAVGTVANAGTGETGGTVPTGVGGEFIPVNPLSDAGASMSLTIGNILFGHEDDIESDFGDVPALLLNNGSLMGLDFVALVSLSGTTAVGNLFDPTDLGQDTSGFLSTPHYWVDFDDAGAFWVGLVTGFAQGFDPEEEGDVLDPILGQGILIAGHVVPEPSLAVLAGVGGLALALLRRRQPGRHGWRAPGV